MSIIAEPADTNGAAESYKKGRPMKKSVIHKTGTAVAIPVLVEFVFVR